MPGLARVKKYAAEFARCPVYKRLCEGVREPLDAFKILKRLSRHCYILESLESAGERGRYTFLGYDPKSEISCANGRFAVKNGAETVVQTDDPGARISRIIRSNRSPRLKELPPFTGGLVGYFAYDYVKYAEKSLKLCDKGAEFNDVDLMLFDKVIAYDHKKGELILIVNIKTDNAEENYNNAVSELAYIESVITSGAAAEPPALKLKSDFKALFNKDEYCAMALRAKEHIREGDIFQAVLSNAYSADAEGSLFGVYKTLRKINPSPYMFYFSSDKLEIAGASPETLVRCKDGTVTTYPLAGTRPRGGTPREDKELERSLLSDEKELAEHNMLVDLGRNDVGKISEFNSVRVSKYLTVERFSHVMHIASAVTGRLRGGLSALDAIAAVLPAGTLSGAPKIRAVQIIDELEQNRRGIYGGAIGYLSFSGDADTCIAIRIAYKTGGRVFVRSGAGIVADSVPESEYTECANKAAAVLKAIKDCAE
ncbi:MAG: anthranilate synthase component I family protein [Clostridiales bacterium]|jgi:anthranilate synthase component 1|nr:anthranilate synthase component I family protein [Clostridiales bacterium]